MTAIKYMSIKKSYDVPTIKLYKLFIKSGGL